LKTETAKLQLDCACIEYDITSLIKNRNIFKQCQDLMSVREGMELDLQVQGNTLLQLGVGLCRL